VKTTYHKNLDRCQVTLEDCMQTMFKNCTIPIKLTDEMKVLLNLNKPVKFDFCKTPLNAYKDNNKSIKRKSAKKPTSDSNQSNQKLDSFFVKYDTKFDKDETNSITRKRKRSSISDNNEIKDTNEIIVCDSPEIQVQTSSSVEIYRASGVQDKEILKVKNSMAHVDGSISQKISFFDNIGLQKVSAQTQKEDRSTFNSNDNDILEITDNQPHDKTYIRKIKDLNDFNKENV
jgi:hypothetical protein